MNPMKEIIDTKAFSRCPSPVDAAAQVKPSSQRGKSQRSNLSAPRIIADMRWKSDVKEI